MRPIARNNAPDPIPHVKAHAHDKRTKTKRLWDKEHGDAIARRALVNTPWPKAEKPCPAGAPPARS